MAITVGTRLTGADTLASAMAIGVKPAKNPWITRATRSCCTEVTSPIAAMMTTKPARARAYQHHLAAEAVGQSADERPEAGPRPRA